MVKKMLSLGGQTFKKKKKPSVQHVILGPIGSANKNNYLFVKRLEEFSRHFKVEGFFNYSKHFAIGNHHWQVVSKIILKIG